MNSRPHIVYVTFDGILEPLGYSQVVRVITELARRGAYRFTILSLEKDGDRSPEGREQRLEARLLGRHIRWRRRSWTGGGGPLEVAQNVRAMTAMLQDVVAEDGADLIHARSYVPASIARRVGRRHEVPYLFDTRGFWVDERLERGRWFGGAVGEQAARIWESKLYEDCAAAVALTELAAEKIRDQRFGSWPAHRPLSVIPTCVDYGEFGLGGPGDAEGISEALQQVLEASLVVGYVGAVNQAYLIEESLRLFDHILARRPDAHLLCLTRNPPALLEYIEAHNLPNTSYTVQTASHDQMPGWLRHIDWGLLLRNTADDQRAYLGAMPTKLGEFFASGVRPVYWGHSREVRQWIERADSGHVLDRCDEEALVDAADFIARSTGGAHRLWGARWRTQSHFGLRRCVDRYHQLYQDVLEQHPKPRMRVLFLTEGTTVPASRFRVQQLVPHLERRGIDCTVRAAYGDGYNHWSNTAAAPVYKLACSLQRIPYAMDGDRFDVVFLQRPALPFSAIAEKLANWRNPHTIFDVDDAIFVGADGDENARQKEAFQAIVSRCAHVICGNDYLADETRQLTPTSVIPTVVDTDVYRPNSERRQPDRIVIGWMGTASNFDSLSTIAPMLGRLATELDEVSVQLVSNRHFQPLDDIDDVHQYRWSANREVEYLQGFDIGLMPLVDNAVTRGKCGFKAIQYMAVKTPVVASAVGVNNTILEGEDAGILADDLREFESAIRRLIDDEHRRHKMGQAGRRLVKEHYSVQSVIDRYVELFEAVSRRRPMTGEIGAATADVPTVPDARL